MRILVVEDDRSIADLIKMSLEDEGYTVDTAFDGLSGADLIEERQYDLALLDIMLPGIDGFELLEYIQPEGTPVIFITARDRVEDKIRGLKLGADDYIAKPFQVGELLARVEAVLRRSGKEKQILNVLDMEIDLRSRTVKKQGGVVELTVKEFDLLVELAQNKNIALYRNRLYEKVWQEPFSGETRTLDSHIQRLRRKLDLDESIKTVFRIGYRLEAD